AHIVVTATTVTEPHIGSAQVDRGMLLINVSLDDLDRHVFLGADLLYVDDWSLIVADRHRLLGSLARQGVVSGPGEEAPEGGRAVDGTLGQLLAGQCSGRSDDEQVIVVNPFGLALEDIAVAHRVHAIARQRGL